MNQNNDIICFSRKELESAIELLQQSLSYVYSESGKAIVRRKMEFIKQLLQSGFSGEEIWDAARKQQPYCPDDIDTVMIPAIETYFDYVKEKFK